MPLSSTFFLRPGRAKLGYRLPRVLHVGAMLFLAGAAHAQAPTVATVSPKRNDNSAPRATNVAVSFSQALSNNASTQQALKVFSQQAGGRKAGTATIGGNTITFDPSTDFKAGETVSATITSAAQSSSGQNLAQPQVFQFTTATAPALGSFVTGNPIATRATLGSVALGDLDSDGDLDFVTSAGSLRLNNGDGSFSTGTELLTGAFDVALGDVDGDGDLDVVSAVRATNSTVTIRLNNGNATFANPTTVGVGVAAYQVALGDIDGDGDLDMLVGISTGVNVRLNDGTGNFSVGTDVAAGTIQYVIRLGDLDNDGDLDYVTQTGAWLNNGKGVFSRGQVIPSSGYLGLGDVDDDGDLDLVLTPNNNDLSVLLNNGSASFSAGQVIPNAGIAPTIALGDVDGDGDLDFLATSLGTQLVNLRLNNGSGTFSAAQDVTGYAPSDILNLPLGDLDGNGTLDFVTGYSNQNTVNVHLNQ